MIFLPIAWSVGFVLTVAGMIATNATTNDPADHWPPQAVFLAALWPLILVFALIGYLVELAGINYEDLD